MYMYLLDWALNNLQLLICHKTKQTLKITILVISKVGCII